MEYSNCLNVGHININSVRHTFNPLREALSRNLLMVPLKQETKLNDTFPQDQLNVPGFKQHREHYQSKEDGIMALI